MPWHYVYNTSNGRLVSESELDPGTPPAGFAVRVRADRADASLMWDEATQDFIARPPRVWVDRAIEFRDILANDPVLVDVWGRLNPQQRQVLRDRIGAAIIELLGRHRYRPANHPYIVDPEDGSG